ncbi:MAG: hypothetical protein IPL52_11530 [Flavobacteriales bacterium]|nr:hypothetical protein [Flavobacteriales bacterium]
MGWGFAQTFQRVVGQPNRNERRLVHHRRSASGHLPWGSVGDSALVQRIDADGNVLWSRLQVNGQYPKMVYHAKADA